MLKQSDPNAKQTITKQNKISYNDKSHNDLKTYHDQNWMKHENNIRFGIQQKKKHKQQQWTNKSTKLDAINMQMKKSSVGFSF